MAQAQSPHYLVVEFLSIRMNEHRCLHKAKTSSARVAKVTDQGCVDCAGSVCRWCIQQLLILATGRELSLLGDEAECRHCRAGAEEC